MGVRRVSGEILYQLNLLIFILAHGFDRGLIFLIIFSLTVKTVGYDKMMGN